MSFKTFALLISLIALFLPPIASATDQVWIHVNYPDDIVYTDAVNVVEVWVLNEHVLSAMTMPFGFSCSSGSLTWMTPYGTYPAASPCLRIDDVASAGAWNLGGWQVNTTQLPSTILIGGAALPGAGLPVHSGATRIFSMRLDGSTLMHGGEFCVTEANIPPLGWGITFDNGAGGSHPLFYPGQPNVCFPIMGRNWIGGDANNNEITDISDAVNLLNYIFAGGPAPFPLRAGDANCDEHINISDCVCLIAYIFAGGSAPC